MASSVPDAADKSGQISRRAGLAAAASAATLLVLFGVIIIKITNKDGTTTEIKVPDTTKVEVTHEPDPKADPRPSPPAEADDRPAPGSWNVVTVGPTSDTVEAVAASADERYVACGDMTGLIRVYDARSGALRHQFYQASTMCSPSAFPVSERSRPAQRSSPARSRCSSPTAEFDGMWNSRISLHPRRASIGAPMARSWRWVTIPRLWVSGGV